MTADTASPACSTESNEASAVLIAGVLRSSRALASVMIASVPSLPVSSPVRSSSG